MIRWLAAAIAVLVVAAVGLVAVGFVFGNPALLVPRVPPSSGMDRFLLVVWPTACLIEVLSAGLRARASAATAAAVGSVLRLAAAWQLGWGLLWGSVHLRGEPDSLWLGLWAVGGAVVWQVLPREKSQRWVATALVVALVATGGLIVWGGWLKGGLTSLPLACAVGLLVWRVKEPSFRGVVIGCGAAATVGLATLGHFFGRVSGVQAALLAASLVGVAAAVSWPRASRAERDVERPGESEPPA